MVEEDLGKATVVYEHPGEGTVEETVENEHVAYFQDHWIVKTGENEAGHDTVRRIPVGRVHYVERDVEEFEEELETLASGVASIAQEFEAELERLRQRLGQSLPGSLLGGQRRETEPHHIEIETEDAGSSSGESDGS